MLRGPAWIRGTSSHNKQLRPNTIGGLLVVITLPFYIPKMCGVTRINLEVQKPIDNTSVTLHCTATAMSAEVRAVCTGNDGG